MLKENKAPRRSTPKPFTTWTRFYLPRDQEWPIWSVDHPDIHVGPLAKVAGDANTMGDPAILCVTLGRIVDDPEQAVYIIDWRTLDDFNKFQSSPACQELLRNLPEHNNSQVSVQAEPALGRLTLAEAGSLAKSRFLVMKHAASIPTGSIEGRLALTSFVLPRRLEQDQAQQVWQDELRAKLGPRYFDRMVWFYVLNEDSWVQEKFGRLEQTQEHDHGRAIFCHFRKWTTTWADDERQEREKAQSVEPRVKESWARTISKHVMPPVTEWVYELWDIRRVPCYDSPYPETDPETDPEEVE
ncbi:hypothetical protein PspLS_01911 [Pyricularia sp. CBS 133598]|nr:hypothetical protein PspLS_01911 [Pyricularia sp. CBS 133598]